MKPDYRRQMEKVVQGAKERRRRYREENLKLVLEEKKGEEHEKRRQDIREFYKSAVNRFGR